MFNYKIIVICIFLSTSFAYLCPEFIKDYGFLGYDLPIPQAYHSHPYFFYFWTINLMGSVSIYMLYYICCSALIKSIEVLGKIYFKFCSLILCGSNLCETGYVVLMTLFMLYSAFNSIVVIFIFIHFMVLIYRGRLSKDTTPTVETTISMV